jgi:hypothetical protein
MNEVDDVEDLRAKIPAGMRLSSRSGRPVHTFTVPEAHRATIGLTSLGLVELTADEELSVMSRMRGASVAAGVRAQYDLAKASIVQVDGKPVSSADESLELAWVAMRPKARALLLRAFQQLHSPPAELEAGFLSGETTSV